MQLQSQPLELFPPRLNGYDQCTYEGYQFMQEQIRIKLALILQLDLSDVTRFTLGDPLVVLRYVRISGLLEADVATIINKILSVFPDYFRSIPDQKLIEFVDKEIKDQSKLLLFTLKLLPTLTTSVRGAQYENVMYQHKELAVCYPLLSELYRLGFEPGPNVYEYIIHHQRTVQDIEVLIDFYQAVGVVATQSQIDALHINIFNKSMGSNDYLDIFWLYLRKIKPSIYLILALLRIYYRRRYNVLMYRFFTEVIRKIVHMYPDLSDYVRKYLYVLKQIRTILSDTNILVDSGSNILTGLFDSVLIRTEYAARLYGLSHDRFAQCFIDDLHRYLVDYNSSDDIKDLVQKSLSDEYVGNDIDVLLRLMNTSIYRRGNVYVQALQSYRLAGIDRLYAMLEDVIR